MCCVLIRCDEFRTQVPQPTARVNNVIFIRKSNVTGTYAVYDVDPCFQSFRKLYLFSNVETIVLWRMP